MIKFTGIRADERVTLFLGLSRANLERLPQDQPIKVDLVELGLDQGGIHDIVIFAGETEEGMLADLNRAGVITPETKMTIEEPEGT